MQFPGKAAHSGFQVILKWCHFSAWANNRNWIVAVYFHILLNPVLFCMLSLTHAIMTSLNRVVLYFLILYIIAFTFSFYLFKEFCFLFYTPWELKLKESYLSSILLIESSSWDVLQLYTKRNKTKIRNKANEQQGSSSN